MSAPFSIDTSRKAGSDLAGRPLLYTPNPRIAGSSVSHWDVSAFPNLWSARWPNQSDPNSIPVQTGQPKDSYAPIYGPWDDPPNPANPWRFWQYASTGRLSGKARSK